MRKSKSQEGYALVLVLFLIVFIMIFSAVFMRGALSNAKQEKIVDSNHLAVVASEMGVDLYKSAVLNAFYGKKDELINSAQSEIDKLYQNSANLTSTQLKNQENAIYNSFKQQFINELNKGIVEQKQKNKIESDIYYENISIRAIDAGAKLVKVNGIVIGIKKGANEGNLHENKMEIQMIFQLPSLNPSDGTNDGNSGSSSGQQGKINMYQLYPTDVVHPKCDNNLKNKTCVGDNSTRLSEMDKTNLYLPNGHTSENENNLNLKNSVIYSKDTISFKNINSLNNITIYTDGAFSAKNMNGQGLQNSNLFINNSSEFDQVKMNNSSIVQRGAIKINDHLTLSNNSKMCVAGSIHVVKSLTKDASSKVYVWGTVQGINESDIIRVKSVEELVEKCVGDNQTGPNSPILDSNWPPPEVNVDYVS
ncbi:hypothetical protein [Sporosarcina newyorkensis]|uniref:hypothetical protein n=1 Tax=Sporosarcina newyorkensis TaxID=759851 RepID=UPI003D02C9B0